MNEMIWHLKKKPLSDYQKPMQSVFPTIAHTVQHIYDVDALWLSRCKEGEYFEKAVIHTPNEAEKAFAQLHDQIAEFAGSVDTAEQVRYQNSAGTVFVNTVDDILRHLVNHGTYHRGNLAAMLRQMGHPGISTDYIYFLRQSSQ
jgi:uncharacterized damage-inducible protein DinB